MKNTSKTRVLRKLGTIISLCQFSVFINACATPGAENHIANGELQTITNENAGTPDTIASTMNHLADDLSATRDVYRVADSIILRFLDEDLFRQDDRSQLSPRGDSILKPIANILSRYPTTRIYVQEFVPNQQAAVSVKRHALDQAFTIQSALVELGIPANRISVDIRPRPSSTTIPSPVSPSTHPASGHIFELNIVPAT